MENEDLFKLLAGKNALRPELKSALTQMIKREVYVKNQIILSPGQVCNRAWFIEKGAAMGYVYKDDKKVPYWFWDENEIMINVHSFFKQAPSETYIELLEPSIMISISYDYVQEMVSKFPETNNYILSVIQEYQRNSEKRILALSCSAEEHYLSLMKDCPALFRKASVESIAAYLGVSRKTLNRIRSKNLRF